MYDNSNIVESSINLHGDGGFTKAFNPLTAGAAYIRVFNFY